MNEQEDAYIPKIDALIRRGLHCEALVVVDEALSRYAWFHLYLEKKAEVLAALGNIRGAIEELHKARHLNPDLAYLGVKISDLSHKVGETGRATDAPARFCGIHERAPDTTGARKAEGGTRLGAGRRSGSPGRPLVSIVTVVYNNPVSLERCIASVLRQDYPDIEYIVIDGGSSEPTLDIIRRHADRIDYYVSEPDKGIYQAMNKGIRLAGGEYVCLLNSDDEYDPSFVSKTVAIARSWKSALVFTDYIHGQEPVSSRGMDPGILFGHLNLNHSSFLVHRRCYDLVGPYDEEYRIISDAVWMREAFRKGVRFDHLPEHLFRFATGGLSAGITEERRLLFISEVVRSYRRRFPFLSEEEAESIYLLRFSPHRIGDVVEISVRHESDGAFREALARYVEHCLRDRENFRLEGTGHLALFETYQNVCENLGIPADAIRFDTGAGCFSEILATINRVATLRKRPGSRVILHFLTVFSRPSETFVYDLLTRLEENTAFDNFVLHEHALLQDRRPFAKAIHLQWGWMIPEARDSVLKHLFKTLNPSLAIGHFAINSWKLHQLIEPLGIRVPILSMTHGIDVFTLADPGEYRDFVLNDLARRDDARFTAVSRYLRDRLISCGVPADKIDLVHNTVHPRFFAHRKTTGFRSPGDPLRILAVGRLIDIKGHDILIEAVARAKEKMACGLSLSIVYGNGGELLAELTAQIRRLSLGAEVELIPFVDFRANPDYFSGFDLFIHPSTHSKDSYQRPESFGIAVLEAIAAGLPVIATDAGGVPEVLDTDSRFARIVPHGSTEALADAILAASSDTSIFAENREYAEERLAEFSEENQIRALTASIYRTIPGGVRASLFSTITLAGAGYAAYRVHRGLLESRHVTPTLLTTDRSRFWEPGVKVVHHPAMNHHHWRRPQSTSLSKPNLTIFTINTPILHNRRIASMVEDADVINLHWSARFLSIENIAFLTRLGKPVVMTIRDMTPLTGGCHFFHGCDGWMSDCLNCPQLIDDLDGFPAKILAAKRRLYDFTNITMVALSNHSAEIIRHAPRFRDCRIEVIPNSIETEVFRPHDRAESRRMFNLPLDRPIIAYVPSYASEVKGYNEAAAAFRHLQNTHPGLDPLILLIGSETPATDAIRYRKHTLEYIHENETLARAYSAADVVIVPSTEETFSNTTAEAISCGTPVVGFRTGAIPDMVRDGETGYCLEIGDVEGFADGIAKVLGGPDMRPACRRYAEDNLAFGLQAARYEELFLDLVSRNRPSPTDVKRVPDALPETSATVLRLTKNWIDEAEKARKMRNGDILDEKPQAPATS